MIFARLPPRKEIAKLFAPCVEAIMEGVRRQIDATEEKISVRFVPSNWRTQDRY